MMNGLNLYFHWPFCVRKCPYCAFYSLPWGNQAESRYLEALLTEINFQGELIKERGIRTIYFGGGTPSIASPETLHTILNSINHYFPIDPTKIEVTVEANPDSLTEEKLKSYLRMGINRLSLGLQSAVDRELKIAGRVYTVSQFRKIFNIARNIGFKNINVDVIFGLPKQTNLSWIQTLETIIGLKPEHISTYSLELDHGSVWGKDYKQGKFKATDDATDRQRYYEARIRLMGAGYIQYEISNFCLPGYESKHNLDFWMGRDYLGFGSGSESYLSDKSFKHLAAIKEYLDHPTDYQVEEEQTSEKMKRMMWLSLRLRLITGFKINEYKAKFKIDPETDFGDGLAAAIKAGWLKKDNHSYQLTLAGLDREKAVSLMIYSLS